MLSLRMSGLLSDITLVADGVEIQAHKMILASCSPYFYAMFTGKLQNLTLRRHYMYRYIKTGSDLYR